LRIIHTKMSTVLPLLSALLLVGCTETEVHLVPAGYRGDVFIVPGIPTGSPPRHEGGAIVFAIPSSGILVTQAQPSRGWHMTRYYYLRPDGHRERLEEVASSIHDTRENRVDDRPIAFNERYATISAVNLPCTVSFVQYYVGSRADLIARKSEPDPELRFRDFVRQGHVCISDPTP
jgi:hypothetical protein